MPSETKTIAIPSWFPALGKYLAVVAPVVLGFWMKVHDMERDFQRHREEYEVKVEVLVSRDASRDVAQAETIADLRNIKEMMARIEKTMERLAAR